MDKFGIKGIYETHLPVADIERSIAFYGDQIGLELAYVNAERSHAFFWVGGRDTSMLGLWETGHSPLRMTLHFAFRVGFKDVMSACNRLSENNIIPLGFHGEPVEEPVVIGWVPAASVYFKDPDGHSLEFISVLNETPDLKFGVHSMTKWQAR